MPLALLVGPRTRARSRGCSIATWSSSTASPCSSCRTGRTSIAWSATCSRAGRRSSAAGSGPSTTSSAASHGVGREPRARRRRRAADAPAPPRARRREPERARRVGALRRLRRLAPRRGRRARVGLRRPGRGRTASSRSLYAAYRDELDRLELWDRERVRGARPRGSPSELGAWDGEPVFAYGFEDLTGAEWELLEALAGRAEVTVSLPYEPGRPAFASLARTAEDLPASPAGRVEELPPAYAEIAHPALAHLERALFAEGGTPAPPPLDGAVRFLEGAGARGALELVADELLALIRDGHAAGARSASSAPASSGCAAPLETVLGRSASRMRSRARSGSGQTPFGQALLAAAPFAWQSAEPRRPLRLPPLAVLGPPARVRRLPRGPAPRPGRPHPTRRRACRARCAASRCRRSARCGRRPRQPRPSASSPGRCSAGPTGSTRRRRGRRSRLDLRAHEAVRRLLEELDGWSGLGGELARGRRPRGARAAAGPAAARRARPGACAVLDLLRARTRRFDVVFVLGLEEGSLPRRADASPFLDDDARRALDERAARGCSARTRSRASATSSTPPARGRRGGSTSSARRRPTRARPRQASPFWDEVRGALRPRGGAPLGDPAAAALGADLAARRGADRAGAAARARRARRRRRAAARALAAARTAGNGGSSAPARPSRRPTRLTHRRARGACVPATASTSPSSRRSPTAPRSGSSSGSSRPARSTREVDARLRARSRTRAAQVLRGPRRRRSAPSASSGAHSRTRSASCGSASTRRSAASAWS